MPWLRAAGPWGPRFWSLALALGLGLALLLPTILAGQVAAIGDGLAQDWPMRLLVAREWLAGHWPVWNPFHFGGAPLWAAIQPGVLFPGNLPFLFLPPGAAWHAALALAYASAALGAMALARAQGLPWVAAWVAGLCFGASGFMLGHVENLVMIQAAAGLPWVLAAIARLARGVGWAAQRPWVFALAIASALTVLAGHPQMAVFTALWGAAFALAHLLALPAERRAPFCLALLAGGALGAMLSAPAWLPAALWLPHTSRAEIPYRQLAFRALPARQLLALWLPFAFGGGGAPGLAPYWGAPAFAELQGYASLGAWGLAALAFARGRRRVAWLWGGMALVAALLAMGPTTPLFRLWAALPLLKSLPVPGRHLLAFDLGLAMLAGLGLARLWAIASPAAGVGPGGAGAQAADAATPPRERSLAPGASAGPGNPGRPAMGGLPLWPALLAVGAVPWLAWLGVALFGPGLAQRWGAYMPWFDLGPWLRPGALAFWAWGLLALAWGLWLAWGLRLGGASRGARWAWAGALAALLALDLGAFAWGQAWAARGVPTGFVAGPWAPGPAQGRVLAVSAQRPYPFNAPQALQQLAYPGWGALAGVPAVQGYDAFVGRRYAALAGRMEGASAFADLALLGDRHRFLDLAAVAEFWLEPGPGQAAFVQALPPTRWAPALGGPGRLAWTNRRAFPRAWRVASVAAWPQAEVDLAVQGARAWQPEALALVDAEEGPSPAELWAPGSATASFPVGGLVQLASEGPGPGFVVLSEAHHPGWQAELLSGPPSGPPPGSLLPVRRTNGWQLGVAVPEGAVRVRLRFWPPGLNVGLALAALALLACVALLGRKRG